MLSPGNIHIDSLLLIPNDSQELSVLYSHTRQIMSSVILDRSTLAAVVMVGDVKGRGGAEARCRKTRPRLRTTGGYI